MTNTSGRIPKAIDRFNAYINNTETYLKTASINPSEGGTSAGTNSPSSGGLQGANWQRLGMISTEMDSWTNYKNQWNDLYVKYSDKEASRTTVIKDKLRGVQSDFKTFAQRLLNMMAGMRTSTDDDAAVLNFVINRAGPSHSNTPIEEIPTFSGVPIGGAVIKFSFRATSDSNRAGKLEGASGIEIRYQVGDGVSAVTGGYTFFVSTRSIFKLTLPENNKGKTLYVSARWVIASDPGRNGPWSSTLGVVIA